MLFSSLTFLYLFLPCLILVYFLMPKGGRNGVLLLFSLQLLSPLYDVRLESMLGLPHDPLRLHFFYAKVYLVLAAVLLIKNWRQAWDLRKGFKV